MRLAAGGRDVVANLSAESITNIRVLDLIDRELHAGAVDPVAVGFELTETALMNDIGAGEAFAEGLAKLGCRLALDDFGTGYGSFTYLKRLPVGALKIDVDFVRDLAANPANQHLVCAIVGLAQGFQIETVAEGVEDEATLTLLSDYGVDYAQGYHLGRPAPIPGFAVL
jgi:EAL domain-containing protein (putative c-di-GMP-specific phosphodiesterase class I)